MINNSAYLGRLAIAKLYAEKSQEFKNRKGDLPKTNHANLMSLMDVPMWVKKEDGWEKIGEGFKTNDEWYVRFHDHHQAHRVIVREVTRQTILFEIKDSTREEVLIRYPKGHVDFLEKIIKGDRE